jgi:tetratricopeptide (TPR) repeat protein
MVATSARSERKLTSYESELSRTDEDIAGLEVSLEKTPGDIEKRTRLAYRLYHRATLTASARAFEAAGKAIDEAISRFGPQEDLCLLKANLDFRFHRLREVERDLRMAPKLAGRFEARSIQADLAFQRGQYKEARAAYEDLIAEDRTWDNLARVAHFHAKMADADTADGLYVEAEEELTAKEMRSFAWLELQRGVLDIAHGRYEDAAAHYRRAGQAYSGYWLTEEHMAEVLGATGKFDQAVAMYTKVIARAPKPELLQTLGELHMAMGEPAQAAPWFEKALAAYLESAGRGEVQYFHHLTDFYAEVRDDAAEAVKWARQDIELRENFSTQAALAWALYRDGAIGEALVWMDRALSSGAADAELFQHAAKIYEAADRMSERSRLLASAAAINPHYGGFHVHR